MKSKKIFLVMLVTVFSAVVTNAQEGFGTNNPAPSSVIDMVAANKGALLPRVALKSIILSHPILGTPPDALTVFNTATTTTGTNDVTPGYYYWLTDKWVRLLTTVASSTSTDNEWHILGNSGTSATTNFLGTIDANDLVFRTTNSERLRLTKTGRLDFSNTSGTATNIFIEGGNETATGANNTALGVLALTAVTTGSDNVAVGNSTLNTNTTGTNNVAIGYNALATNTVGSGNIALGSNTNVADGTLSNQLNIGNSIFGTGLTGTLNAPAGNIGIKIVAPNSTLQVNGSISTSAITTFNTNYVATSSDYFLVFNGTSAATLTIPAMEEVKGRTYIIKNIGTVVLKVTTVASTYYGSGSGTSFNIGFVTAFPTNFGSNVTNTKLIFDGTNWIQFN